MSAYQLVKRIKKMSLFIICQLIVCIVECLLTMGKYTQTIPENYLNFFGCAGLMQLKKIFSRHLVISCLAFPLSKLKTIDYLYRYQGVMPDIDAVYRFLDKLKEKVEQISLPIL